VDFSLILEKQFLDGIELCWVIIVRFDRNSLNLGINLIVDFIRVC
jgi:hypothetical protein